MQAKAYDTKPCYGKCDRCVWKYNGGCSEWNKVFVNKKQDSNDKVN